MFLVATLLLLNAGHPSDLKKPAWVGATLAGYPVEGESIFAKVDRKTGYFLVREVECDGADTFLRLTKDRHLVDRDSYFVPGFSKKSEREQSSIQAADFINLKTGSGGGIGDTKEQIFSQFGKPFSETKTGYRKQFVELVYSWTCKGGTKDWSVTFTLKQGKVIEILLGRENNEIYSD